MLVYLGICALLAFLAALSAVVSAVPPAPTFHLAFAAGAMPLIFGAIIHFVPVLTRTGMPARPIHYLPIPVQLAGITTPLGLAGTLPAWSLHVAATVVVLAALLLISWISRRLRATLGGPHPGARWYGAALLCLFFAVSLVPVWLAKPELRTALRLFHLHLNTLGFIGLAALGTLPVLLPSALGKLDLGAADRLRRDLLPATVGALLVAAGASSGPWLALPGALLLLWVVGRNLLAWYRSFGFTAIVGTGATAALLAATLGLALLLLLGMAHGAGLLPARLSIAGFVAAFLLPLVTGTLSQLLPVWRYPGNDSPQRLALRQRLTQNGRLRAVLFLVGGVLLAFDNLAAWLLVVVALALFVVPVFVAIWLDRPRGNDDNSRPI
jgi:hypothetical protein